MSLQCDRIMVFHRVSLLSDSRILRVGSPLTSLLCVRGVVKSFTPRPLVLPLYRSLRYHSANSLPLKHALWWPLRFTKRGDEQELRSAQNSPPLLHPSDSLHTHSFRGRTREGVVCFCRHPGGSSEPGSSPFPKDSGSKTLDPGFRRGDGFEGF